MEASKTALISAFDLPEDDDSLKVDREIEDIFFRAARCIQLFPRDLSELRKRRDLIRDEPKIFILPDIRYIHISRIFVHMSSAYPDGYLARYPVSGRISNSMFDFCRIFDIRPSCKAEYIAN